MSGILEMGLNQMEEKSDFNQYGVRIYFNEELHKYRTDTIDDFTSVTTLIEEYFEPFDNENIANRYAIKHNRTKSDVIAEWDAIRDEAAERGSLIHLYCENKFLNLPPPDIINEKDKNIVMGADEIISNLQSSFEFVEAEKIIFSERYKLAGMIDLIMKKDDTILLLDWKTTYKKIEINNKWHKYGLNHCKLVPDTNFGHYSLQLNMYKWLLLNEGYYDCDISMAIIHLVENDYKVYNIPDMQSIVKEMIDERKFI
jgi:ATP-dependent exoDNAse (exonuclease V) beta subunit